MLLVKAGLNGMLNIQILCLWLVMLFISYWSGLRTRNNNVDKEQIQWSEEMGGHELEVVVREEFQEF